MSFARTDSIASIRLGLHIRTSPIRERNHRPFSDCRDVWPLKDGCCRTSSVNDNARKQAFWTRSRAGERGASSHTSGLWKDCALSVQNCLQCRRVIPHCSRAESSPIRKQRLPRCPAAVIDRRTVRLRKRSPLLWAYAHLEWDVDLTHRLVDCAWLRGSFEAVCEQVRPQRK
jgi:hypothetical protein